MSFRDTHPSRSSVGWKHGIKVPAWDKRVPNKTPGHVRGQKEKVGTVWMIYTIPTLVNPPSSATGITRCGKSPSRILPAEGGRIRTSSPQPRSESAGGADRSPEGDPPRRRRQTRESGDACGRAIRPFDYFEQKQQ